MAKQPRFSDTTLESLRLPTDREAAKVDAVGKPVRTELEPDREYGVIEPDPEVHFPMHELEKFLKRTPRPEGETLDFKTMVENLPPSLVAEYSTEFVEDAKFFADPEVLALMSKLVLQGGKAGAELALISPVALVTAVSGGDPKALASPETRKFLGLMTKIAREGSWDKAVDLSGKILTEDPGLLAVLPFGFLRGLKKIVMGARTTLGARSFTGVRGDARLGHPSVDPEQSVRLVQEMQDTHNKMLLDAERIRANVAPDVYDAFTGLDARIAATTNQIAALEVDLHKVEIDPRETEILAARWQEAAEQLDELIIAREALVAEHGDASAEIRRLTDQALEKITANQRRLDNIRHQGHAGRSESEPLASRAVDDLLRELEISQIKQRGKTEARIAPGEPRNAPGMETLDLSRVLNPQAVSELAREALQQSGLSPDERYLLERAEKYPLHAVEYMDQLSKLPRRLRGPAQN
jgi:hypothetical protein